MDVTFADGPSVTSNTIRPPYDVAAAANMFPVKLVGTSQWRNPGVRSKLVMVDSMAGPVEPNQSELYSGFCIKHYINYSMRCHNKRYEDEEGCSPTVPPITGTLTDWKGKERRNDITPTFPVLIYNVNAARVT